MQWYLVAPTYKKSGEARNEYREGSISTTSGKSIKFIDHYDEKFVRYALLRDEMLERFDNTYIGTDEFDDEVGYIFICGECLRKLVERFNTQEIIDFEFLSDDKLTEKPIIRFPIQPPTVWGSYNSNTTYTVEFFYNNHKVNIEIRDFFMTNMSITTQSGSGVANQYTPKQEPKKENKIMNLGTNLFKDLYFGKAPSQFALSFNNQITYNGKYYADGAVNDACGLTLDFEGLLYIMPTQELKAGDIVAKKGDAFYFDGKNYISLTTGQKAEYVPTKVLGMTFYSVVKNLAGNMFGTADSKINPMANMLPFLLLGKDNDSDDLVKFMLLSQGGFNFLQPQATPEKK